MLLELKTCSAICISYNRFEHDTYTDGRLARFVAKELFAGVTQVTGTVDFENENLIIPKRKSSVGKRCVHYQKLYHLITLGPRYLIRNLVRVTSICVSTK